MSRELFLLACSFWQGAFLLILYDGLRILRSVLRHDRVMVALEDIGYWIFAAVYLFVGFYRENSGILRAYLFAGILLGMAAWHWSLSPYVVRAGSFLAKKCLRILEFPFRVLKKARKRLKFYGGHVRMNICRHRAQGRKTARVPQQKNKSQEASDGASRTKRWRKR